MPAGGRAGVGDIAGFCGVHPDLESAGVCVTCGRGVCLDCRVIYQGRVRCKGCLEAGLAAPVPAPGGDPRSYFGVVEGRLAADGFARSIERLGEFEISAWYKKGTAALNVAHSFVLLASADFVSRETLDRFCLLCEQYCVRRNPGIRGLSLLLCYPVLGGRTVDAGARDYAARDFRRGYVQLTMPVVVDLGRREVTFLGETPFIGMAGYVHGRNFILRHFVV